MRTTRTNSRFYLFLFLCITSACQKDDVAVTGDVVISFIPEVNSGVPESYYLYLYLPEQRSNNLPLAKKNINEVSYVNQKPNIKFNNLNPGNYIFTYYRGRVAVDNSIQIASGKTNNYDF